MKVCLNKMHNKPHSEKSKKLISKRTKVAMRNPILVARLSKLRFGKNRPDGVKDYKICFQCKKRFKRKLRTGWKQWIKRKYCSKKCEGMVFGESQKGSKNRLYGKLGKLSPVWKGDKIGYSGIHDWLKKKFGKANKCENLECLKISKTYEWAKLRDKSYQRRKENFWMLCHSCHKKYDSLFTVKTTKPEKSD